MGTPAIIDSTWIWICRYPHQSVCNYCKKMKGKFAGNRKKRVKKIVKKFYKIIKKFYKIVKKFYIHIRRIIKRREKNKLGIARS